MKISCITIHRVDNFGSVLQTLATQWLWNRKGVRIEFIDYIPERLQLKYRFAMLRSDKSISLKKKLAIFLSMDVVNKAIYNRFLKRYIHLSQRTYYSFEQLKAHCPKADFYMSGSDQVWNAFYNKGVDTAFYLAFAPAGSKRVSFVSSFGRQEITADESAQIKPLLEKYAILSVRETTAVKIIEDMGLPSPVQLLDPTLLISQYKWLNIFPPKPYGEKYVLIYSMSYKDPQLFKAARTIADYLGVKVWFVNQGLKRHNKCDRTLLFQTPHDFISLMQQAECVVTNSFHGTAFAINFKRPFAVVMPYDFGTRIESLLNLFEMQNHIYNGCRPLNDYLHVPGDCIDSTLKRERRRAETFMEQVVRIEK